MCGFARVVLAVMTVLTVMASITLATPALSQQVDCRNGSYCPAGNVCLKGGLCGVVVDAPPGSVRTATGYWCEPGFREHRYRAGSCVPNSYSDCTTGGICPPGTTCTNTGSCTGGKARTGPPCGTGRCEEGRICSSAGRCMNTTYYQDCGGGTICSKNKACAQDGGCAIVGIARTQQIPFGGRRDNSLK